jgi:hypothetical protein
MTQRIRPTAFRDDEDDLLRAPMNPRAGRPLDFQAERRDEGFVGSGDARMREPVYAGARGVGFSPRASNILSETMDGDVSVPAGARDAGLRMERFDPSRGRETANLLAQTAAMEPDRNFEQAMNDRRRMLAMGEMDRAGGFGVSRGEARATRDELLNRQRTQGNLELQDRAIGMRGVVAGEERRATVGAAEAAAAGAQGVAQIGADVDLVRLAQEKRLAEGLRESAGFQTGPGGDTVFQGPLGTVDPLVANTPEGRAQTFLAKLNEDLARGQRGEPGGITQEQFDMEIQRRARQDSAAMKLMQAFGLIGPDEAGAAGGAGQQPPAGATRPGARGGAQPVITGKDHNGRRVVSTDGGKTFTLAE